MHLTLDPYRLLLISLAGWMNQQQQDVIEYLQEENRVLHEQLGTSRLRLNDEQRRRLVVKAKKVGQRVLRELAAIVTPETLLGWYRKLIACGTVGAKCISVLRLCLWELGPRIRVRYYGPPSCSATLSA